MDEERMRGQLREALAALGLDESLADAAELSYGSELGTRRHAEQPHRLGDGGHADAGSGAV